MNKDMEKKLLTIVKSGYEEIADDFNETRKKDLWPELIKLADLVKDGDSVLDAGCGNGRLLEAFKGKNIIYTGIDSSKKLIELAKNNYKLSIKNYEFLAWNLLDLDKLPFKNFNYIFCIAVLHHLPGENLRLKILENLKNKLAGNGKIILTVWNLWGQKKFRNLIIKSAFLKLISKNKADFGDILFKGFKSNSERYYHAFREQELKNLIKKSDLKIENIYKDNYNYYAILKK